MDGVYFCPDVEPTPRRKPAPGMVLEACRDLDIDPTDLWFVIAALLVFLADVGLRRLHR